MNDILSENQKPNEQGMISACHSISTHHSTFQPTTPNNIMIRPGTNRMKPSSDIACKALVIVLENSMLPDTMGCWSRPERREKETLDVNINRTELLSKLKWSSSAVVNVNCIIETFQALDIMKAFALFTVN